MIAKSKMADAMFVVVMVTMLAVAWGQKDTSVCTVFNPGQKDPVKPTVPDYYEVHTECNIKNRHFTSDYHEWYDKKNQRVAVHIKTGGVESTEIYNFPTQELFHIDRQTQACSVVPLPNAPSLDLFGQPTNTGNATIFSAAGALHFGGKTTEQWINQTAVRGVMCNMWRSCQYWQDRNATMIVDWYFSTATWHTANIQAQVPVRAHVYGKVWEFGKPRAFDHSYEFADVTTVAHDLTVFETPPGVFCPKRKNTNPLPTPASAFHFTAEIVELDTNVISFIKEYYDYDLGLVRYDSTPTNGPYGTNLLTEVHDFNTGVAYVIDTVRGNCTATAISNAGFDVRNADPTHVRIRSSKEFFYFDKTAYVYEGTRSARNILTDVWIAERTDWPSPGAGLNSTWEWYFASSNYVANLPDTLQFGMPVMMTLHAGFGNDYVYNIYDYDERKPAIWSYDISQCFNYTEKRDFTFKLPGSFRQVANSNLEQFRYASLRAISKAGYVRSTDLSALRINNIQVIGKSSREDDVIGQSQCGSERIGHYRELASSNLEIFKYYLLTEIQGVGGLSALRINNIQVDYADNNDIIVQFTLLDKAPQIGDVQNPKQEQDLNTVATSITAKINSGMFVVKLKPSTGPPVSMTAIAYTLTPTQHVVKNAYYTQTQTGSTTSIGTSGGAMAGMGVALLVLFFILGVAATYMFYRRQGGAFSANKFENENEKQDED